MIIRTIRKNRFTVIPNDLLEDTALDWKDLGLLVYLLSKPDNWEISVEHLKKQKKLGRDGIYKCLDAIIAAGYARREKKKDGTVDWYIFDDKENAKNKENPVIKPNTENTEKAKQSQIRKIPITENPNTENPTQVNTEYKQEIKKEEIKTEKDITRKKKSKPKKKTEKEILTDFGIDGQVADDFLQVRKAKRAPVTMTAMKGIRDQAEKAGISIVDAVTICVERGWQGFNASWNWQQEQKSPGAATNNNRGLKQPPEYPDYSVLWEGDNFIDSTAEIITDEPKRL